MTAYVDSLRPLIPSALMTEWWYIAGGVVVIAGVVWLCKRCSDHIDNSAYVTSSAMMSTVVPDN